MQNVANDVLVADFSIYNSLMNFYATAIKASSGHYFIQFSVVQLMRFGYVLILVLN
jgi:hypothetical protein